jgi:hypothetical protein
MGRTASQAARSHPTHRTPLEWILDALERTARPMAVSEIAEEIRRAGGPTFTPEQVKYRVGKAPDRVRATGQRRGRRYELIPPSIFVAPAIVADEPTSAVRSPEAREIQDHLRTPPGARTPVGYDRKWLDAYEPGITWYLTNAEREGLRSLGASNDPDRPAGSFARDILERLLIDLAWASSRLEGNTYSRLDTQNLIEFGQAASGKDAYETRMILNHKAAIELLVADDPRVGVNTTTLLELHAALSADLLPNPRSEGRLRRIEVRIGNSAYHPTAIPQVIEECFARIVATAAAIPDPFEASFFLLVHLPYLQPFVDVNKRTARLAANLPLVAANLCPLTFVDVPEVDLLQGHLGVYELRRTELLRDVYLWAYRRSCREYRVVRDALPPPDPIRLRYRQELSGAISTAVRAGGAPDRSALRAEGARLGVAAPDLDAFEETAFELLLNLHAVTATRYGLSPEEFTAWRDRFPESPTRSPSRTPA